MKRYLSGLSLVFIMILFCQPAVYAVNSTALQVSTARVTVGSAITVSGTSVADSWVSIKGVDSAGNILYLNSVLSDSAGAYSDTFKAPDMAAGTLTIVAGSGADVANANVEVYASSNGNSGGSSSGSSSDSSGTPVSSSSQPTTTTSQDGKTVTTSTTTTAQSNAANGNASATIEAKVITTLTDQAQKSEKAGKKAVVEIKVEAPADAKTVAVTIPRTSFDKVADNTRADISINTGLGTITFDGRAVDAINGAAAKGDITVSISRVETSTLSKEAQNRLGDRPVYDLSVMIGSKEISSLGGGTVQVSIPYMPKPGENKNAIVVYCIDSKGRLNPVRGRFDAATGTVNFTLAHLSRYVVGYNEVKFIDVADTAWHKEAVDFIAARGITSGKGNGSFGPDDKLTRGQYLVMMMKAYGIEPDGNPSDNFTDAGNTYYTGYLAAAKRLGLASGTGNNMFAPDKEITRQEVFSLLYRTLKNTEELPSGLSDQTLDDFNDADLIASWANEAVTFFVKSGTIGGVGGRLNPNAKISRSEMAQVLYNLLAK